MDQETWKTKEICSNQDSACSIACEQKWKVAEEFLRACCLLPSVRGHLMWFRGFGLGLSDSGQKSIHWVHWKIHSGFGPEEMSFSWNDPCGDVKKNPQLFEMIGGPRRAASNTAP